MKHITDIKVKRVCVNCGKNILRDEWSIRSNGDEYCLDCRFVAELKARFNGMNHRVIMSGNNISC